MNNNPTGVKSGDSPEKLTPALAADFFDFFDNRAFSDHLEWSFCYCTFFHSDFKEIDKEVKAAGGGEDALHSALRGLAGRLIESGRLSGYLAYSGGAAIGFCNVNYKSAYRQFDHDANLNGFIMNYNAGRSERGGVKAVTCFTVAPEYRGRGVASALLKRALDDAEKEGCAAVEGYPRLRESRETFDYTGPFRLWIKSGFREVANNGSIMIMRKDFKLS